MALESDHVHKKKKKILLKLSVEINPLIHQKRKGKGRFSPTEAFFACS